MAEVLLFHHAQGLTPGVNAFADDLRSAGHTVHTPDLFGGRTFLSIDEGMAHIKASGMDEMVEKGERTADDLPNDLVYAGFSFGEMIAQEEPERASNCLPGSVRALPPADAAAGAYMITKLRVTDADPKTVTITCAKDGYRFDKVIPRDLEPKVGQPVEIDCVCGEELTGSCLKRRPAARLGPRHYFTPASRRYRKSTKRSGSGNGSLIVPASPSIAITLARPAMPISPSFGSTPRWARSTAP